jgi:hypothetical protein
MRILGIVALCAALAGCAGTDTHLRMLENSNALQIEPSQIKDFDYVVRMKNLIDIAYDPDNPETRKETALRTPAQEPSAYCRAAAVALFQGSGVAELAAVQQGCRRGDIIAISTSAQGSVFQIGRMCDFSKAIMNAGGQVLCALTGARGSRFKLRNG